MKSSIVKKLWHHFKTWFLPQPSHDELFPEPLETSTATSDPGSDNSGVAVNSSQTLESAADMERRAARETITQTAPLKDIDFSSMVQPPEGSGDRASRSDNPFSRSQIE